VQNVISSVILPDNTLPSSSATSSNSMVAQWRPPALQAKSGNVTTIKGADDQTTISTLTTSGQMSTFPTSSSDSSNHSHLSNSSLKIGLFAASIINSLLVGSLLVLDFITFVNVKVVHIGIAFDRFFSRFTNQGIRQSFDSNVSSAQGSWNQRWDSFTVPVRMDDADSIIDPVSSIKVRSSVI